MPLAENPLNWQGTDTNRKMSHKNYKYGEIINIVREKERHLTQSYGKSPYIHKKIQKATWKHKNDTKNFYYTSIADRLRTE